jgi:hypothetical protein
MRAKSGWGIRGISVLILAVMVCAGSLCFARTGQIVHWGSESYGVQNIPSGNDFVAIAAGHNHGLALRFDGSIAGWGDNTYGQATPPAGNNFIAVAAHYNTSLAIKSDGSMIGWGESTDKILPPPSGNDFIACALGAQYGMALKSDGSIVEWGSGSVTANIPSGNDFVAIAAGSVHRLASKSDGSIVGWVGNNLYGNLYGQATPPAGNDFVAIAAGINHSIALKANGTIVCWGDNNVGQAKAPAGNNFVAINAVLDVNLALKSDGSIIAWGRTQGTVAAVPAGKSFIAIVGAAASAFALKMNDEIEREDLNSDGVVNLEDWAELAGQWSKVCRNPTMCGCADFDGSRKVDLGDLMTFAEKWIRNRIDFPIAFWPFDGTYLPGAGTFTGVPYGDPEFLPEADARIGTGAIDLDDDDYVVIEGYKGILGDNARTCTAWIRTTNPSGGILGWGDATINGARWRIGISGGKFYLNIKMGSVFSETLVNTGEWVHVATVYPNGGKLGDIKVYINGIRKADLTNTNPSLLIQTVGSTDVQIGSDSLGAFVGQIDDVRIYDRALTAEEIAGIAGK